MTGPDPPASRALPIAVRALVISLCLCLVATAPARAKASLTLAQLRATYAAPGSHIMPIDGVEVYYRDEGQGPAILLIHGSACTSLTWDAAAAILRRHARIIRFDIPPLGLSGPLSDAALARLTPASVPIALLDRLGIKQATIIGVSSGGTLAIEIAAQRPDLVKRLILSDSPADPVPKTGLQTSPALAQQIAIAQKTHVESQAFWNAFLDNYAGDPTRFSPAIRRQFYDMNRRQKEPNQLALVARVADHAAALRAMAAVHAPVLLIWGARDNLLPPQAADTLAGYLKNTTVSMIFLPDVGHFPPIEVPDRFAALVTAYMTAATP